MRFILNSFLLFIAGLLIINCGDNKSENNYKSGNNLSSVPDKKMCELLTKEMMSSITGISFNEEISTLHQNDKSTGKYVSQCGYHSETENLAVLVRRFGNTSFPKKKEKLIGGDKTGNPELDAIQDKALKTCKTVTGLGDAAYFYDLGGLYNLIVIFDDHYQLHITSYGKGFGFDDKTMEISRKVAKEVIKIFS
jgi:hypothetical protein